MSELSLLVPGSIGSLYWADNDVAPQTPPASDVSFWKTVYVNDVAEIEHDVCSEKRHNCARIHNGKSQPDQNTQTGAVEKKQVKSHPLMILCHCFPNLLIISSFLSNQNLQSSLNSKHSTGILCLSSVYIFTVFGYLIVPKLRFRYCSITISVISAITFAAYFASFATESFYFQLSTSCVVGLSMSVIWIYSDSLLVEVIREKAHTSKHAVDIVAYKTSSLYDIVIQSCHVWGNLITTAVFAYVSNSAAESPNSNRSNDANLTNYVIYYENTPTYVNYTYPKCGAHHLPQRLTQNEDSSVEKIYHSTLACSYVIACALSFLVALLVTFKYKNPLDRTDFTVEQHRSCCLVPQCDEVIQNGSCPAASDILRRHSTALLVPFAIFIGMQQAFTFADLTKYYISCTFGASHIGTIFTCYGLVVATTHFTVYIAYIWRQLKRVGVVAGGAVINAILLTILWRWRPHPGDTPNIYVVTSCLGFCDVIWQTHVRGLLAEIFKERYEAQSAIYRICVSVGCAIGFTYSSVLCARTKVYILSSALAASLVAYGMFEFRLKMKQKRKSDIVEL